MQQENGTMKMLTEAQLKALRESEEIPENRTLTPIFSVGDLLEIRGGKFRIVALGTDGMRLRGVPWSTVE